MRADRVEAVDFRGIGHVAFPRGERGQDNKHVVAGTVGVSGQLVRDRGAWTGN